MPFVLASVSTYIYHLPPNKTKEMINQDWICRQVPICHLIKSWLQNKVKLQNKEGSRGIYRATEDQNKLWFVQSALFIFIAAISGASNDILDHTISLKHQYMI